jgi:hypothetical protein
MVEGGSHQKPTQQAAGRIAATVLRGTGNLSGNTMSTQTPQEISTCGKISALGVLLMLAGIIGAVYFAFGFQTVVDSVNGQVVNFNLQQQQLLGFLASLAAAMSGLIIVLFVNLPAILKPSGKAAE